MTETHSQVNLPNVNDVRSGDLVLYHRTRPSIYGKAIRFSTGSKTEHAEVVGRSPTGELMVGNAVHPRFKLDRLRDRISDCERGKLKFIVMRWHHFMGDEYADQFKKFQRDADTVLQFCKAVPPKYDTMSIATILGNIIKRTIRSTTHMSTRNWEHAVYCTELCEVVCRVCGGFEMLAGLPHQTHSAPVHLERQLRAHRFEVIADFGDLSRLIFTDQTS